MNKVALLFILFGILGFRGTESMAQCDPEQYTNECIPRLGDGFNFLKSYKVDGEEGNKRKVEYSYVFTKGTQYMINLCANGEGTNGIVVSLYDSQRNLVASSKYNNQFISAIAYPCNTTGIYYIQYTFEDAADYCGGSALGFKR
jgi:hypothetical protein